MTNEDLVIAIKAKLTDRIGILDKLSEESFRMGENELAGQYAHGRWELQILLSIIEDTQKSLA